MNMSISQMGLTCGGGGYNVDKMAKNCMKITKSTFWGQNSGGTWGCKDNFLGSGVMSKNWMILDKVMRVYSLKITKKHKNMTLQVIPTIGLSKKNPF